MKDLAEIQNVLGFTFQNTLLLEQALVHSSYINENPGRVPGHNERLEFLGDAVLEWVISQEIYEKFPDYNEGDMTKLRATLVRRETLARVARSVGLGNYLYMGKGEETSGGRNKTANLAGALEALIAAVYIDKGEAITKDLVLRIMKGEWEKAVNRGFTDDYKSMLQTIIQAKHQVVPVYRLVSETGPDHDKRFTVEVKAKNKVLGRGTGKSKKIAETEAALAALEILDTDFNE